MRAGEEEFCNQAWGTSAVTGTLYGKVVESELLVRVAASTNELAHEIPELTWHIL
jgi:hypothetical protein